MLRFLVFRRRHACEVLEIFAKRRLVGEIQRESHLLDVFARKAEHVFGLHEHEIVNPARGAASCDFLDDERQVFGRDAEF